MPSHRDITRASIGILQRYQAQKVKDDLNIDDSGLDAELRQEVEKLRHDPNDIANTFSVIPTVNEDHLYENQLLTFERITSMAVVHAYCEKCGAEIISTGYKIIHPTTGNIIYPHKCSCGAVAHFEKAYPRLAYFNEQGEEINIPNK